MDITARGMRALRELEIYVKKLREHDHLFAFKGHAEMDADTGDVVRQMKNDEEGLIGTRDAGPRIGAERSHTFVERLSLWISPQSLSRGDPPLLSREGSSGELLKCIRSLSSRGRPHITLGGCHHLSSTVSREKDGCFFLT